MKKIKTSKDKVVSWDTHFDKKYSFHGTETRTVFEMRAKQLSWGNY